MNSLNLIGARVSPPQTPAPSRTNSTYGTVLGLAGGQESRRSGRGNADNEKATDIDDRGEEPPDDDGAHGSADEKRPLLGHDAETPIETKLSGRYSIPNRIASAIINSLRWVVSTLAAPGVYLIACLYDERGHFSPLYPLRKLWPGRHSRPASVQALESQSSDETEYLRSHQGKEISGRRSSVRLAKPRPMSSSSSSGLSSESESERSISEADHNELASTARHTRSKSAKSADEIAPARRSIRIKLHAEDPVRQRKHRKTQSINSQSNGAGATSSTDILPATLKSPTSPSASLMMTKYPRAPAPPRPLIPRRQPSYTFPEASNGNLAQRTLILDLDETLIHSMAKGGRMSTGHMVEVKLNTFIGVAGQASVGPQHPILYYVHKRPHCDDFLRRVRPSASSYSRTLTQSHRFASGITLLFSPRQFKSMRTLS